MKRILCLIIIVLVVQVQTAFAQNDLPYLQKVENRYQLVVRANLSDVGGYFEDGKWHVFQHLNGDQTHQGRHIRSLMMYPFSGSLCMNMNDEFFNHFIII